MTVETLPDDSACVAYIPMLEYPKIETLYDRNGGFKVDTSLLRFPEFAMVKSYHVTEKIHGENIRVRFDGRRVEFGKRTSTDIANFSGELVKFLTDTFPVDKMSAQFPDARHDEDFLVYLFGEWCGPGVQKNGQTYAAKKTYVLFDVKVGKYWLEPENISAVAQAFGLQEAPVISTAMTLDEITEFARVGFNSPLSLLNTDTDRKAEGVIARTTPGLFTRYGTRLMFKLKEEDFAK